MKMPADGSGTPVVFASGLRNPTGLAVSGASIYAVEPNGVATVDLATGRLTGREQIPGAVRLNDIAVAPGGTLFVSDSQRGVIHRRTSAGWDVWLDGPEVARPNGLTLSGGRLVWANNGDGSLKAADLATKKITRLADLPGGIIDGLAAYPDGTLLASHNEGRLYRIATDGSVTLLLDLSVTGIHVADFSFDPASGRIIVPTFLDNRVMAVRIANPRRQ
jgi:glucose/arabinose dehydrogenase